MATEPKDVLDKVADKVAVKQKQTTSSDATTKSPTTPGGLPIEDQLRKEWDANKNGGLPTP
jgi:hypothetical protein